MQTWLCYYTEQKSKQKFNKINKETSKTQLSFSDNEKLSESKSILDF